MLFRIKILIIFIMVSMIIVPSSLEARKKPPLNNRIFPEHQTLNENRPAHRTYPYGGTLVWGVANQPQIINPILTQSSVSATLMGLIFDSLVKVDSKGHVIPGLAEKWDISEDGLEYTFYLRKGVKFHDGVELTAEDVLFTYQQIVDSKNHSPFRSQYELVKTFEAVDKYLFKITLAKPFPVLRYKLLLEIIPKHILEGVDLKRTEFNYHPIGTGPFRFKNWDKKTNQIELEVYPHYFEGRPYLDKIIVKTYSDASQVWAAFMRREVDLIQWITHKDYSILENDPAFKAYAVSGSMYYAIVYNLKNSVWHDRELRQAIAHGIDIAGIIDALPRFEGEKSTGPFHPESPGYNHEVKPFDYDPVKAKMMLMHRGWQDMRQDAYAGENSIRKKNGQELEMRMLVDERNDTYKRMAQVIRQQLAEIGVKVVILYYQDEKDLTEEYLKQNKAQVWLRLFQGLGFDPYEAIGSWHSLSSEFGKFGNYKNMEIDRLIELGNSTKDANKQTDIFKETHNMIYEDQPACFLFYPAGYFAINSNFKNTDEYFNMYIPTYSIKDWYVSKN